LESLIERTYPQISFSQNSVQIAEILEQNDMRITWVCRKIKIIVNILVFFTLYYMNNWKEIRCYFLYCIWLLYVRCIIHNHYKIIKTIIIYHDNRCSVLISNNINLYHYSMPCIMPRFYHCIISWPLVEYYWIDYYMRLLLSVEYTFH